MPRIFDCFPFFNELDLLEIRLHEMSDVVDRFVIAESTQTFAGDPKPLHFHENRERFAPFLNRITHIVVDDYPDFANSRWKRRAHQCNSLARGLTKAKPEDLVLFSDVDEILRAGVVADLAEREFGPHDVACLELRLYNYFVNFESEERWLRSGPRALLRRDLPEMERLRKIKGPADNPLKDAIRVLNNWWEVGRRVNRITVRDAGWHFTYLGGIDKIQTKLRARIGKDTLQRDVDADRLGDRIRSGVVSDVHFDRRLHYRPLDESFPRYLVDNRERFSHLILKDEGFPDAPG